MSKRPRTNDPYSSTMNNWDWVVTKEVKLIPDLEHASLDYQMQKRIKEEAIERLSDINPILRFTMDVKVVMNERRNFINIIIRRDYLPLIHYKTVPHGTTMVTYCFFLSDKIEPFVIITAVDHHSGKLRQLKRQQFKELEAAITEFKTRFGINSETYHYTGLGERDNTEKFVSGGGAGKANKAHSAHFHLKMRIATGMLIQRLPIHGLLDVDKLRKEVEPVRYNYSRESNSWEVAREQMLADCTE